MKEMNILCIVNNYKISILCITERDWNMKLHSKVRVKSRVLEETVFSQKDRG